MLDEDEVGPVMVREPALSPGFTKKDKGLSSAIVPVTLKVIVSPEFAMVMASRSEPGPESFRLATTSVAAPAAVLIVSRTTTANPMRAVARPIRALTLMRHFFTTLSPI